MPRRAFRWPQFNRRQTRVLAISAALLLLIVSFPPWVHEYRYEQGGRHQVQAGFRFIADPPVTLATYQLYTTRLDYPMLLIELLGVIGFALGGLRTMADGLPRVSTRHRSFR